MRPGTQAGSAGNLVAGFRAAEENAFVELLLPSPEPSWLTKAAAPPWSEHQEHREPGPARGPAVGRASPAAPLNARDLTSLPGRGWPGGPPVT